MWKEFKEFIRRGSVLDLAIGIVIGAAFGKIVTSFLDDILMPPIGLLLGNVDFNNLFINISGQHYDTLKAAKDAGAATINYGLFISAVLDFLIVALVIFLIIRQVNRMKRTPAAVTKECAFCLSSIPINAIRCPHCTSELKATA
jgi:large conductance mechanosensitive channel